MLSGQYRTESLLRFWTTNKAGICLLGFPCTNTVDSISHILTTCPNLGNKRSTLIDMGLSKEKDGPLGPVLTEIFSSDPGVQTQFLLDPLSHPKIIFLIQTEGNEIQDRICYFTRTFCFSLHRERQIRLGKWVNSGYPAPRNPWQYIISYHILSSFLAGFIAEYVHVTLHCSPVSSCC